MMKNNMTNVVTSLMQNLPGKFIEGKFIVPSCSSWKHHGIQGKIHSTRLLKERRNRLQRDICTSDVVHFHYIHTYMYEMGDTSVEIKITLLNDLVKEEVYVEKPLGVKTHDKQNHVCKLKKALYELRRHPWDRTYSYIRSLKIT